MGLGPYPIVTLERAREKALDAQRLKVDGRDPIAARDAIRAAEQLESAKAITFKDAAERYIEVHKAGWKNEKHGAQWLATLSTYAYPIFGSLSVGAVDTALVTKVLEPIWSTKAETAGRLRGRIESILDWATARGLRQGENPARWRGHLENLLPQLSRVKKVEHHAALPYQDMPAFMGKLREQNGTAARALEFTVLTAARTGEVIYANWSEFDLQEATWTIPAERMKNGRAHRVPLTPQAMAILNAEHEPGREGFVFPGLKSGKPLSNMSMLKTLERMGRHDLTVHGFRSSFRDWAAEATGYPREVAEAALAHSIADKVEAAYRRTDLFDKRRKLMSAWAQFCCRLLSNATTNVVEIKSVSTK